MAVVVELTAQSEALKKEHAAQQLAHEATIDELKQNIAFSSVPELQAGNNAPSQCYRSLPQPLHSSNRMTNPH